MLNPITGVSAVVKGRPGDLVAPCGCMLVTRQDALGNDVVTLIPHDINCDLVKASIDEAIAADKDVNLIKEFHE